MRNIATTLFAAALLLAFAPLSQAQATFNTGVVTYEIFGDGDLGTDSPSFAGTGFTFNGEQGLFASTVLVASGPTAVSGTAYEEGDWVNVSAPAMGTAPIPGFDQAWTTSFDDSGAPSPNGVLVELTAYASTAAGFQEYVVLDYEVTNTTGSTLNGIYVGNFTDWDVDTAVNNQACFDDGTQTLYVFAEGTSNAYFGVSTANATASGWDADGSAGNPTDENVWTAMTTTGTCSTTQGDRRVTIGQGPFDIPAGESIHAEFCVAGGTDLADLEANMASCAMAIEVAIEPGPDGVPGTHNLGNVYPNPFNPQASFTLEVAEQQNVRIALYDALGREVATLHSGSLSAGTIHSFQVDGANLPSGTYLVRAVGERFTDSRQVTLLK